MYHIDGTDTSNRGILTCISMTSEEICVTLNYQAGVFLYFTAIGKQGQDSYWCTPIPFSYKKSTVICATVIKGYIEL